MNDTIDLNKAAISLLDSEYNVDFYDNLLWQIAVCSEDEILRYAKTIFEEPLFNISVPLKLVLLRLAALVANARHSEMTAEYVAILKSLCDPADEKYVIEPILNRIDKLQSATLLLCKRPRIDIYLSEGAFLVRAEEIAGMSPLEIQQYLALPTTPTHIRTVTVPAGTRMQVGRVGSQPEFGVMENGGMQYQLLDQIPSTSFGPSTAL